MWTENFMFAYDSSRHNTKKVLLFMFPLQSTKQWRFRFRFREFGVVCVDTLFLGSMGDNWKKLSEKKMLKTFLLVVREQIKFGLFSSWNEKLWHSSGYIRKWMQREDECFNVFREYFKGFGLSINTHFFGWISGKFSESVGFSIINSCFQVEKSFSVIFFCVFVLNSSSSSVNVRWGEGNNWTLTILSMWSYWELGESSSLLIKKLFNKFWKFSTRITRECLNVVCKKFQWFLFTLAHDDDDKCSTLESSSLVWWF